MSSFFFGKPGGFEQAPSQYSQQQQDVFSQMLQGGGQQLPQMFQFLQSILSQDPEMMKQFEAPARRQFEEQTIPGIAERFSGMGAQRSSGFGQQLGAAGAGLEESLAAQRGQMGMQAMGQLQNMLSTGLTPQIENIYRPETFGFAGEVGAGLGKGLGGLGSMGLAKLLGF